MQNDSGACIRAALLLSVAFFLVFTLYNGIEKLETSVIRGKCHGCLEGTLNGICQLGSVCQDKVQFNCDEACTAPFMECTSTLGNVVLGLVYLSLMFGAIVATGVPSYFGIKKSLFGSTIVYPLFALANLIIALNPINQSLHWAIMVPASSLLGLAASVLWVAQSAYLTQLSVTYAKYKHEPVVSSMGFFNGLFFCIYQSSAVSGNFISSFVLGYLSWSTEGLFAVLMFLGSCGAAFTLYLPKLATPANETELVQLIPSINSDDGESEAKAQVFQVHFGGLWSLVKDNRMLCLMPVIVLNGLLRGFVSGEFTSIIIRESVGSASIGYVMALYGGVNALSSYAYGRMADRFGPTVGLVAGFCSMFAGFCLCYGATISKCDSQWPLVLIIAVLLSLGEASSTTLTYVVLGQEFPSNAVNAFAMFSIYQSASSASSFFFFDSFSFHSRLQILMTMVVVATVSILLYTKKFRRVSFD
ncbi:Aste57867_14033 [Aphanomyces stellatus]|uniref:Aste57867_14033 protein n=1 Tax=Aphanomyces stellatus TaxID=120398 RepID=A0A485KZP3_9STRA|nr:hypothetical protein As57867_013982 [Aphanomyces stellatus]VFT90863.1 Aste57867_14033 [Aphanomyces stellatus]